MWGEPGGVVPGGGGPWPWGDAGGMGGRPAGISAVPVLPAPIGNPAPWDMCPPPPACVISAPCRDAREEAEDALLIATPPRKFFRSCLFRWILSCASCICSVCRRVISACCRFNSACSLCCVSKIAASSRSSSTLACSSCSSTLPSDITELAREDAAAGCVPSWPGRQCAGC